MTRAEKLERAGDYALGLLEGAELAAFEAALGSDPELAAMVASFETRLHALDDTATPAPLHPKLWAGIEARLDGNDPAPPRAANQNGRIAVPRWGAVAASALIGVALGYFAAMGLTPQPAAPVMVAVLINETDATPGAIIEAFGDDSIHVVPLENFEVPEGRVLQVWTLPDPATGPVSLGTLASATEASLPGAPLPAPAAGQLYEITLEPAPGSPTGRPTGPILVKGYAKQPI